MKLLDRYRVEGTLPAIYIGHRVYPKANGGTHVSRTWYAEWCQGGRHDHEALRTTTIRRAHDICRRAATGEPKPKV